MKTPLFGNAFRCRPQPALPLFVYVDVRGASCPVRGIGHSRNELIVLFSSRGLAEQMLHPTLRDHVRVLEIASLAGLLSYLRVSGARAISVDPEQFWSEVGCYSHRRLDCPVTMECALVGLEAPPPPPSDSGATMRAPPDKRATACLRT